MRLRGLHPSAALEAVVRPLEGTDRSFAPGVAERLVENLGDAEDGLVEPVQLQVVCERLWRALPARVDEITDDHVQRFGDVDRALAEFYEEAIEAANAATGAAHIDALRAWVERNFITSMGTRNIVVAAHGLVDGLDERLAQTLEERHLLHSEWRRSARWYELSHDRLIGPIRDSNRRHEQRWYTVAGDLQTDSADGVFEAGPFAGLALVGALEAAAEAGIYRWVNLLGTAGGAIVAALLAVGYTPAQLRRTLESTDYSPWLDYGFGGRYLAGTWNFLTRRGLARGRAFDSWLSERFAESPLGKHDPVFADVERELPPDLDADARERARFRLRIVATDVTEGRMLILPDDITDYTDRDGRPYTKEELPVRHAVRMSMSLVGLYEPFVLDRNGREHLVADGGILSNFPISMFDSRDVIRRWTLGMRLYGGAPPEMPGYRYVPRLFGSLWLGLAAFRTVTEAWDRKTDMATAVRTMSIPASDVGRVQHHLSKDQAERLRANGHAAARAFLTGQRTYVNSVGLRAPGPAAFS